MKLRALLPIALLQRAAATPANSTQHAQVPPIPNLPPYTNHIFNAIHSSMRQWGSSVNHNGMSFFIATVPQGVQLYHGTSVNQSITGMEWLAFEPEHAMIFAHMRKGVVPHPPPGKPRDPRHPPPSLEKFAETRLMRIRQQRLLQSSNDTDSNGDDPPIIGGYLHTYATKKSLRLLYVDGMSAAKCKRGTLDTQDFLLLNQSEERGLVWELERATRMCDMAKQNWEGHIDGILRMEAGFEIIMCDFEKSLDTVRITRAPNKRGTLLIENDGYEYLRAVSTRYHGIGGGRVRLNYDDFVTAYNYSVDLFRGNLMPRLKDSPAEELALMRRDVDSMVLRSQPSEIASTDWQGITDMIIQRYQKPLKYLTLMDLSLEEIQEEALRLLSPFHDFDFPNATAEIDRCTYQFLPARDVASLASQTVRNISHLICSTLRYAESESNYDTVRGRLQCLTDYLDWTIWRECDSCNADEICFIAMWPLGNPEDHYSPSCRNATGLIERRGYWREIENLPHGDSHTKTDF